MSQNFSGIKRMFTALVLLTLAFLAFGLWVRHQVPVPIGTVRDTELYSFDYLGYAQTFTDFRFIGFGRLRHPLWGWLMSPVTLWGHRMYGLGEGVFWYYILTFFSIVAATSVVLLYRLLTRRLRLRTVEALSVTFLFLSFAHVWLLAAAPESFGVSMSLSLAMLYWGCGSRDRIARDSVDVLGVTVSRPNLGRRLDDVGWGVLAFLMGGITITQAVKTAFAYVAFRRPSARRCLQVVGAGLGFAGLVVAVFALRVYLRVKANPAAPGFESSWHTLVDNFPDAALPIGDWLHCLWVFFSEPILLRGESFEHRVIVGNYESALPIVLVVVLFALALVSIALNRRQVLVRLLLCFMAFDLVIHFVAQWGIWESHLYSGHWFFAVPLSIGMLFPLVRETWRPRLAWAIFLLALALFGWNIYGFFGHDVGIVWPSAG